jgi:hypothetical protein
MTQFLAGATVICGSDIRTAKNPITPHAETGTAAPTAPTTASAAAKETTTAKLL